MAITATDIAKAAEAINRHPDLSPAARRVGIELLNRVHRATGTAWPSEARMAEALGYDARTIRRGKAALAAAGLLSWVQRGTSWKGRTPIYSFAWDLLRNLADQLKAKLKAACKAARVAVSKAVPSIPAAPKPAQDKPSRSLGRTFSPTYLTQCFKFSSEKGFWKAPGTPQGQHLSDQQLNQRASSRIWEALSRLAPVQLTEFLERPDADDIQQQAIKAERYRPGTGLPTLARLIGNGVFA